MPSFPWVAWEKMDYLIMFMRSTRFESIARSDVNFSKQITEAAEGEFALEATLDAMDKNWSKIDFIVQVINDYFWRDDYYLLL